MERKQKQEQGMKILNKEEVRGLFEKGELERCIMLFDDDLDVEERENNYSCFEDIEKDMKEGISFAFYPGFIPRVVDMEYTWDQRCASCPACTSVNGEYFCEWKNQPISQISFIECTWDSFKHKLTEEELKFFYLLGNKVLTEDYTFWSISGYRNDPSSHKRKDMSVGFFQGNNIIAVGLKELTNYISAFISELATEDGETWNIRYISKGSSSKDRTILYCESIKDNPYIFTDESELYDFLYTRFGLNKKDEFYYLEYGFNECYFCFDRSMMFLTKESALAYLYSNKKEFSENAEVYSFTFYSKSLLRSLISQVNTDYLAGNFTSLTYTKLVNTLIDISVPVRMRNASGIIDIEDVFILNEIGGVVAFHPFKNYDDLKYRPVSLGLNMYEDFDTLEEALIYLICLNRSKELKDDALRDAALWIHRMLKY